MTYGGVSDRSDVPHGYCSGCKKMLPIAVGLQGDAWVLVAHVSTYGGTRGLPCRSQRVYAVDEREENWKDDSRWDI